MRVVAANLCGNRRLMTTPNTVMMAIFHARNRRHLSTSVRRRNREFTSLV
jgi:hypothetical protein